MNYKAHMIGGVVAGAVVSWILINKSVGIGLAIGRKEI